MIKIQAKNGAVFNFPENLVEKITIENLVIENSYRRMVLRIDKYQEDLDKLLKKCNVI